MSFIYNNGLLSLVRGNFALASLNFKALLTTSAYTPDRNGHVFRSSVTNEVTGTGYTAGGLAVTLAATLDTSLNRVVLSLGGGAWAGSVLTARKAVYYVDRGGGAGADELIAVSDFGADIVTTGGPFVLTASAMRFNG